MAVEGRGEKKREGIDEQASERNSRQLQVMNLPFYSLVFFRTPALQCTRFSSTRAPVHPSSLLTPALGSKLLSRELILGVRLP